MTAYYNEFDPNAALWLQAAMDEGVIAKGVIDTRSIEDVIPDELIGFTQCHFFAGIGGWSIALRLAGWPDDKPVWTGSCPCQPFSTAGKGAGVDDPRHLWPAWFWLIQQCKPDTVFGEQVANAVTKGWLDDVAHDLENEGYAVGAAIIPACSVGAPHKRDRLWFVADRESKRCGKAWHDSKRPTQRTARSSTLGNTQGIGGGEGFSIAAGSNERNHEGEITELEQSSHCHVGNAKHNGYPAATQSGSERPTIQHDTQGANSASEFAGASVAEHVANTGEPRLEGYRGHEREYDSQRWQNQIGHFGAADLQWVNCPDGKARPVKSGLCLLADGISGKLRKAALHGFGNAIVPQVAAEFIMASGFIAGGSK